MRKPDHVTPEKGVNVPFPDEAWAKSYPILCEWISHDYWDDGKPREVATLVLKSEEGRVLAALNDKEGKASLYVTGDSLREALKAMEKALSLSAPDWRKWNVGKGKKP